MFGAPSLNSVIGSAPTAMYKGDLHAVAVPLMAPKIMEFVFLKAFSSLFPFILLNRYHALISHQALPNFF